MTEMSDSVISSLFHHTPYLPITEGHLRSQYQETNSYPTPTNKKPATQNLCPFIPANLPSYAKITDADNTLSMSFNQ